MNRWQRASSTDEEDEVGADDVVAPSLACVGEKEEDVEVDLLDIAVRRGALCGLVGDGSMLTTDYHGGGGRKRRGEGRGFALLFAEGHGDGQIQLEGWPDDRHGTIIRHGGVDVSHHPPPVNRR